MSGSLRFPPHKAPGSGAQALIGYDIDLTAPDGSARVILDVEARHMNRVETLHGGIHAMMLDAAAGFAASRQLADGGPQIVPVVTLSLTTSFVQSAQLGKVVATGRVMGGGYKIVHAEAEIHDAEGRLCSKATGVFKRAAK
ncbi:PaaI family thioesterase [Aliishimia ponticola]|uniref:PaaI family thioesterase n=1 Tax=Aliishimia ponticola TaxID=2499833 RepID=UPI00145601CF|nr:PaaI family thioesterase [Aliishimia ponticola]